MPNEVENHHALEAELVEPPEGWSTRRAVSKRLGPGKWWIDNTLEPFKETNPEWFKTHRAPDGNAHEYLAPELQQVLEEKFGEYEPPPDDWVTVSQLRRELRKSNDLVQKHLEPYREEKPDWFGEYRTSKGKVAEHISPDLATALTEEIGKPPPEGWTETRRFANELGCAPEFLEKLIAERRKSNPDLFGTFRAHRGKAKEHLASKIRQEVESYLASVEDAPEDWASASSFAHETGWDPQSVKRRAEKYRREHPEWFKIYRNPQGRIIEHISPECQDMITRQLGKPVDDDWIAVKALAKELDRSDHSVRKAMEHYRHNDSDLIRTFVTPNGRVREYVAPELQEKLRSDLLEHDLAPDEWITQAELNRRIGRRWTTVSDAIEPIRESHPEWFRVFRDSAGNVREHISPDLQKILEDELEPPRRKEARLKSELVSFLEEVGEGQSFEAKEFRKLTELFGSEYSLDLLFQHHPDYRKLPVSHVRSVLGDYLGDFYVIRGAFDLEKLEIAQGYLGEPNLKDGLSEVLKNDGLSTYNTIKRAHPSADDRQILEGYTRFLQHETERMDNPHWREILEQAEAYYRALFELPKLGHLVDELVENRQFPDVNQRINILELARNNKMLIADNMGLGKSASAILAKESLGVEQALVVVPSNVVDTWKKYLSDRRGADGEVLGYFKEGMAPRILTIDTPAELRAINPADYDYVICSHERLTEENLGLFEQFDYDMMIVDEVHKLKNLAEGKRAEVLVKLTEKINGSDEKYLALLSGTPAPNKVGDIAMILKLLYPEKFEGWENRDLVNEIINGSDQVGLRSLLLPRMELKELGESIEMPELHHELEILTLSEQEREIYEILLEEDEITATQKMQAMRRFIMNPELLRSTPSVEGVKVRAVGERLRETFATQDKVVMFVNGYVDGVIETNSQDTTIFDGLDLSDDVRIEIISGSVSKARRREIEEDLKREGQKMLVIVSGQTADVGVDLTGPDEVFFYNEPWTEYDKMQQLARVYRPGQEKDLTVRTFYVKGTIEEGIHRYIRAKYVAIEKLLHGIPPSELERELLRKDEKSRGPNLEVNPELARFYFSKWDNMQEIFRRGKETGEAAFVEHIVEPYGEEYAKGYEQMGRRSYQANVNRLAGSLIAASIKRKKEDPRQVEIIDIASGPEMLRSHIEDKLAARVTSIDINPHHFPEQDERRIVGSYLNLPVKDGSAHYANLALSLHHTSYRPRYGDFERLKIFAEMNRVLVDGGRAVITTNDANDLKDPHSFERAIQKLGFRVVRSQTGVVESDEGRHFKSRVITLEKTGNCNEDVERLGKSFDKATRDAFKLRSGRGSGLRDSRRIVTEFRFIDQDRGVRVKLNNADRDVHSSERSALTRMERLRGAFGKVEAVPEKEILAGGFSRVFNGTRYVLFKSLGGHAGAVVVK